MSLKWLTTYRLLTQVKWHIYRNHSQLIQPSANFDNWTTTYTNKLGKRHTSETHIFVQLLQILENGMLHNKPKPSLKPFIVTSSVIYIHIHNYKCQSRWKCVCMTASGELTVCEEQFDFLLARNSSNEAIQTICINKDLRGIAIRGGVYVIFLVETVERGSSILNLKTRTCKR